MFAPGPVMQGLKYYAKLIQKTRHYVLAPGALPSNDVITAFISDWNITGRTNTHTFATIEEYLTLEGVAETLMPYNRRIYHQFTQYLYDLSIDPVELAAERILDTGVTKKLREKFQAEPWAVNLLTEIRAVDVNKDGTRTSRYTLQTKYAVFVNAAALFWLSERFYYQVLAWYNWSNMSPVLQELIQTLWKETRPSVRGSVVARRDGDYQSNYGIEFDGWAGSSHGKEGEIKETFLVGM